MERQGSYLQKQQCQASLTFIRGSLAKPLSPPVVVFLEGPDINQHKVSRDGARVGVVIRAWNGTNAYRDVRVTHADTHDNGNAGIRTYAQYPSLIRAFMSVREFASTVGSQQNFLRLNVKRAR